ncbi:MAG TPA: HD domain-containing phosphohydrolase [Thermoanaerobaculia bacterium]|nr:HD domain-containing phosphohydrolase [Thermoanaerobaculia bacterium]
MTPMAPMSPTMPTAAMDHEPDLRRRLGEYETLLEIGVQLAGTLDLAQVLDLALVRAEEVCHAETSSIWELDEKRQELFFRVVRGLAAGEIRGLRVPLGQGIVGSVAQTGVAEVVNDVAADPRWRGDRQEVFKTRAILAVPLLAHGAVVGVLQLLNPVGRDRFAEDDLRRMRLFAGLLAHPLQNARLYQARRLQFMETVVAWAEAIEKKDPYTGGHVRRVTTYSVLLGEELGMKRQELEELWLAATLHDVGKIFVQESILRKPAPLDESEIGIMKRHPVDGADILAKVSDLRRVLPGVRSHHERLDGKGYPDGLLGDGIPLLARIIAVADTYDAMTTSRPYRHGLEPARAAAEIGAGAGTQFCPRVAGAFRTLFESGRFTLPAGHALWRSFLPAPEA